MATEIKLPRLGQTMEEGTIVSCLVKVGDEIKKGDVIFEIETDKATLEMESPAGGFVKHIPAQPGQTLLVDDVVLIVGEADEQVDIAAAAKPAEAASEKTAPAAQTAQPAAPQVSAQKSTTKAKASPRAKTLAKKLGVNLETVTGTGPAGRITEQDIEKVAAGKPSKDQSTEIKLGNTVPVNRLQRITANKMQQSKQEIPCFYLTVDADVTELVEFRAKLNETSDVKVAYNDFIIRAVGVGIEHFPIMAGQLDGQNIKLADSVGAGLAISVPDGLVAPILKDVNKKDVKQIAKDSKALVAKARDNKLLPDDLSGGCITVSNLGAFGIASFIPIVVPGQCSILGVGLIVDTCVPDNGNIIVRKLMSMTLSVDHKVANGAYAAQFLDFVRKQLEDASNFE